MASACSAVWTTRPTLTVGSLVAHYTEDPKTFDGIVVPTRRRIRRRHEDGTADMSVDFITLDIDDVRYHTS